MIDTQRKAQYFALNQWLSDYPDDMTYEEVIKILRKDQWGKLDAEWVEVISPWYLIEGHAGEQIADFIEDTYLRALKLLEDK